MGWIFKYTSKMRVDFRASYVSWSRSISMVSVSSLNQVTTSGRLRLHNAGTQPDRDMEWMVVGTTFLRSNSSKSPVVLVLVIPVNHPHFLKIHPPKKNHVLFRKAIHRRRRPILLPWWWAQRLLRHATAKVTLLASFRSSRVKGCQMRCQSIWGNLYSLIKIMTLFEKISIKGTTTQMKKQKMFFRGTHWDSSSSASISLLSVNTCQIFSHKSYAP